MHDLDKYRTDYFNYLEQPENATRYTPAVDLLRRFHHPTPLRVLDLGCGAAALAHYLDEDDTYTGVDHDPVGLVRARHGGPHQIDLRADLVAIALVAQRDPPEVAYGAVRRVRLLHVVTPSPASA